MGNITANVRQIGLSASEGTIRQHHVVIDRPEAKGGGDHGPMGGELLLASLGGCFMSNLLEAIRTREANIRDVSIDIVGNLEGTPPRYIAIELQIRADFDDEDFMQKLVTISERSCIVANTLRPAVDLTFSIRQQDLANQ